MSQTPVPRTSARVVPVTPDGACLVLLERDPAVPDAPCWNTIGGAVDPGESLTDAAVRELREETGIIRDAADLTPAFHSFHATYRLSGVLRAGEVTFFALPTATRPKVSFDNLEPDEVGNVLDARWLTPAQVAADGRLVRPELPDILEAAVEASRAETR